MCGRLACGLNPEQICKCCWYHNPGNKKYGKPEWKNFSNLGKSYKPSYNICPSEPAPVLLSGHHFDSEERIVAPMIFGLIPPWSKEGESSKYNTINCRLESVVSSKLYGGLVSRGQRCIVVCNGFYEWQKNSKNSKNPYFIHNQQPHGVVMSDPETWNLDLTPEEQKNSIKVLKLAALFDKHPSSREDEAVFSFTIITREAGTQMSWLHHRMPLIVENEEQCSAWLQSKEVDWEDALKLFNEILAVSWFPVSNSVNKTANKDIDCIKQKIEEKKDVKKETKSALFMKNWLQKSETKEEKTEGKEEEVPSKKIKKS